MYSCHVTVFTLSLLFFGRPSFVRSSNDETIYSENGGPKSESLLEEEIIEQLAQQELSKNWAQLSNKDLNPKDEFEINLDENADSDTFDATNVAANSNWQRSDSNRRPSSEASKTEPKFKKQGQEEFSTFVDPVVPPNYQRSQAKMSIMPSAEKRAVVAGQSPSGDVGDTVFIVVVAGCTVVGICGVAFAGVMFHRLHKQYKMAQESEYPHYGVTGPAKERTSGSTSPVNAMDAKLASSAQLYHYQHTKQQIIAMEQSQSETKGNESEDSEGEGEEGDFSVYECPGLAPTGDLEVSNPLFENTSPVTKTDPHREPGVHQRATE